MAISLKKKSNLQKNPVGARTWAISLTAAALVIWAFFTYLFDKTPDAVQSWFQVWLPPSTINESLVWVICALGLNIVVGYAGLLDLGFVAFWAFGGYTAGWFMSSFFGNYMTGYLGTFYSTMSSEKFFLMLTGMGLFTGIVFFLTKKPLERIIGKSA